MTGLSSEGHDLLDRARETLGTAPDPYRHRAACALRIAEAGVVTGLHLDATVRTVAAVSRVLVPVGDLLPAAAWHGE